MSLIVEIIDVTPDEDEPLEAGRLERARERAKSGGLTGMRKRELPVAEYGCSLQPIMWAARHVVGWRTPTRRFEPAHVRGSRAEEIESEE